MKTQRFSANGGFTLTELMVVVGILGFLIAVAVPNFLDWNRKAQLKDAAALLHANLGMARMTAINQNTPMTVTLSEPSNSGPVTVTFQNGAGSNLLPVLTMGAEIGLSDGSGNTVNSPQTVQFNTMGLKVNLSNANNLCIVSSGAGTTCSSSVSQAFNLRNANHTSLNYRVIVASTGKVSWCYSSSCGQ